MGTREREKKKKKEKKKKEREEAGKGGVDVFFFNDTATTEIYTETIVGSVRCI